MNLLFLSNVSGKKIGSFSKASLQASKELGVNFHYAANIDAMTVKQKAEDENNLNIKIHHIPFTRNIFSKNNYKSMEVLDKIITEYDIDIIHCNTPIGGVVGRLIAKKYPDIYLIYEAHGFHFFRGGPIKSILLYKNVERYLARYTDTLITMNEEDYLSSKRFKLKNNSQSYFKISGVGVTMQDSSKVFNEVEKRNQRKQLNLSNDQLVFVFLGDLIERKNLRIVIEVISKLKEPNIKFLICGEGPLKDELRKISNDSIEFLGYRTDIQNILLASDCLLFPSLQEGLPRTVLEAMSYGLPCIVSNIRGNTDLIDHNGGILCNPKSNEEFYRAIIQMKELKITGKIETLGRYNFEKVKDYSDESVKRQMTKIYKDSFLKGKNKLNE